MSVTERKPLPAGLPVTERKPLPAGLPVTDEEFERTLLQLLHADVSDSNYIEALWQLAFFYNGMERTDLARDFLQMLLESSGDPQRQAQCYLSLGRLAKQEGQHKAAIEYYAKGLALKPTAKEVAYFLHNDTGYCLNALGRHAEAEHYCRLAIQVDSAQGRAFKNLGMSLTGQRNSRIHRERDGFIVGAAWAYVEVIMANGRNPRTLHLLERLLKGHPELASQFHGILKELEACRKAVAII
jgi:tetratricopeptide (TPR) repeat protein